VAQLGHQRLMKARRTAQGRDARIPKRTREIRAISRRLQVVQDDGSAIEDETHASLQLHEACPCRREERAVARNVWAGRADEGLQPVSPDGRTMAGVAALVLSTSHARAQSARARGSRMQSSLGSRCSGYLARQQRLLRLLDERKELSVEHAAAELGCSRRTVYRDFLVLSETGVPLYQEPEGRRVR
jgi:biotin operon repressor